MTGLSAPPTRPTGLQLSAPRSPLLDRFPQLDLPWIPLGDWPTPVALLARLSQELGSEIWVKQDDCSALRYGGNKVRKLEHLLAEAVSGEKQSIVTVGGIGSNHVVATALHAQQLGLPTRAVVVPQPVTAQVRRNLALARSLGVELTPCPVRPLVPLYLSRLLRREDRPHLIGPGGSSAMGVLGYVSAGIELKQQIDAGLLPEPEEIYVALGSGGSMAGLALGCALAGLTCRVVGVRVVERLLVNATLVRALMRGARRLLGGVKLARPGIRVVHGYLGRCYGAVTPAATEAVEVARQLEGLRLETTYTGKAFAALLDACRARAGQRLLFWNTFNSRDTSALLRADLPPLPERIERWLGASVK